MEHKKFTEAEILIGSIGCLFVDGISFLIDWTGVGLFIAPILQSAAMFGTWWWQKSKGGSASTKFGKQIARYLSNTLPLLPTVTVVFLIETYLHNHPETGVAKTLQGAHAASAGLKAGGGASARVAAARKAYHEAPAIDSGITSSLESERTSGTGMRGLPIRTTRDLRGVAREEGIPEPIE